MAAPVDALSRWNALVIHDTITSATSAPVDDDDIQFNSGDYSRVRILTQYDTVTACNLAIWQWDRETEAWYPLGETDDVDALTPTGIATEARDVFVGRGCLLHIQAETLTGTNATVAVLGVDGSVEKVGGR